MTIEIIAMILGSSIVSSASTWLFTRNKYNAETKVVEGDAIEKMQAAYVKLVVDMENRFDRMKTRIDDQEKTISDLRKDLDECKKTHIPN